MVLNRHKAARAMSQSGRLEKVSFVSLEPMCPCISNPWDEEGLEHHLFFSIRAKPDSA